jgi:hypothetical protein
LKRDKKKKAEKIIKIVIDSAFWEKLGALKRLLFPLAACVDKSQADNCDLCTGAIIFLFLLFCTIGFRKTQLITWYVELRSVGYPWM